MLWISNPHIKTHLHTLLMHAFSTLICVFLYILKVSSVKTVQQKKSVYLNNLFHKEPFCIRSFFRDWAYHYATTILICLDYVSGFQPVPSFCSSFQQFYNNFTFPIAQSNLHFRVNCKLQNVYF